MNAQVIRRRAGAPQNVDGRIPHRDSAEAGEDGRVSKAEQEDRMPPAGNPTTLDLVIAVGGWAVLMVVVVLAAKVIVTGRVF